MNQTTTDQLQKGKRFNTKKMVTLGLLGAISIILVSIVHFPLFPAAPFLEYDPADIPILIGTLAFGPMAGIALTIVVSFIQMVTVSGASGIIGFIMHVIATGSMCLVVGFVYHKSARKISSMVLALILGCITMTVVMVGLNLIMTPIFTGQSVKAIIKMLVPVIIPFNLLKALINSFFAFFIAKTLEKIGLFSK